ncbi:glycerophosphodiester phosphodiesterase family protein [Bacillaceae bacterium SIJ1]|uniref:glycerophosphodiester phosphodiesterase family protein n=1 Tax=Litoribacterium kuwaitense TaxID=1398745 RepID=UPI0013EC115D|nr:glycerophosphodiester phosphodiesterase family protein [Litoribacterium kuwaitense]NGP45643.1 glycerophosphodiester phosphodiesterase family protein [Litoribacterium kuwaitense]
MNLIQKKLQNSPFLIAVHRGSSMGNIVENTIPAFQAAVQSGGDMLEIDVVRSTDGKFYVFHDGNEKRLLGAERNITTMHSTEIEAFRYRNNIGHLVNVHVEKLADVLSAFKGDVIINLDRSWEYWDTLLPYLDQFDMQEQILLKSPVKKEWLTLLNDHPVKYPFIPIIHTLSDIEEMETYKDMNTVGLELIARNEESPLFQSTTIQTFKDNGYFIWLNAIRLDDDNILFAGRDDDASIIEGPEYGWQQLIDKGADIIQTDWPSLMYHFREGMKSTT